MSKKIWSLISLLLIATLVLAACGTPAEETEPPAAEEPAVTEEMEEPAVTEEVEEPAVTEEMEEPAMTEEAPAGEEVTISIWNQWDGNYLQAIEQAFADYEEMNPNVTIDLSKPEDVASALNVAIPAGEGPDIIAWANDKIGEQALAGNIVPLEDYGIDMAFLESVYEPAAVNGVIYQDIIWALPETQEGIALVANNEVVGEEYLPTDPLDFEDLYAKAEQFQADTGNALICNQGFGANDAYHMAPIYFGHGVPAYVDDEGNAYMDTPEAIAAGQWLDQLATVSLAENSYDICNANLAEGTVGMWWTGPWAIRGLEDAGIDYSIVPMGRPFVGIKTMMLTENAVDRGNAEVAIDIMRYFTSPEVQRELALANKTVPAQTEALADPEVAALPSLAGFGEALNQGVPMASTPFAAAQWDPVGNASAAIWNQSQEPEQALQDAQAAIENAVAEMQ